MDVFNSPIESCSLDKGDNCLYFDCSKKERYELVKKMMTVQYDLVCKGKLTKAYCLEALRKMSRDEYVNESFGYFSYYPGANSTRFITRSGRGYQNDLGGIAICLISNKEKRIGTVEILCSKNKSGTKLLQNIEEEGSGRDLRVIQLFALPEDRLKKWYQDRDYLVSDIPSSDGTYMAQKILS